MSWFDFLKSITATRRREPPPPSRGSGRDDDDLQPGMVLGGEFRIEAILGEGGFGRVFHCSTWQGRSCAVKVLRPRQLTDRAPIELMRKEVQRWVELGIHPHIVTAFGLLEHARLPCLLMEYLQDFEDLAVRIQAGAGNWRSALRIGAQVAAALDHGHRRSGLVHRDIKPGNILVNGDDWAKLSDFGISVSQLTETDGLGHMQLGTVPYMAPELWHGEPDYSVRSDFYALGVTLFEAATGRHPLTDGRRLGFEDYRRLHGQAAAQSPLRLDPSIPPAFAAFLLQCLDKDPARRPRDAAEACAELVDMCRVHDGRSPLHDAADLALDEADTWADRSNMYCQLGLAGEALECAELARTLAPDDPHALTALGNAHALAERWHDAIPCLRRAAEIAGADDMAPLGSLSFCLLGAGDKDGARRALEQALALPGSIAAIAQFDKISKLIIDLLEPQQALALCDRIIAQQPQSAITWNNRAVLCVRMGSLAEALKSLDSALRVNPVYATARANMANVLMELHQWPQAREAAAQALALDDRLPGAYAAHYAACLELGDVAEAEATLTRGLAVLPDNELLRRNRDRLSAYKQEQAGGGEATAATASGPLDDAEAAYLADEIASRLRSLWSERMGVVFQGGKQERAEHSERSSSLTEQIRALGLQLQRRGGLAAMHAVVKAVNRIDSRCKDALEQIWGAIPGYKRWKFLP